MSLTTGINSIDALVSSSWADKAGTAVTLTYSFMTRLPSDASNDDANGFKPMTEVQKAGVRTALATWAAVANITFQEVGADGNLQMATNNQGKASSGYAYLPNGVDPTALYTNNQDDYNSVFTPGEFGLSVLIHEIGHTLGFKHPGNYDSTGGDIDGPFLPAATDTIDYSQMSYNVGAGFDLNGNYGITPMLYDIQAIQYLYGANMSYHTGADTYAFGKEAPLQCIWDAGGTDTFDFSACTGATIINLNAGSFSSTAPGYNNISIAYNVSIERAIAGSGGSTIYANSAGNVITGGAGNDVIYEGAGDDVIAGGGGSDTVVFSNAITRYGLNGKPSQLVVVGEGFDALTGISTLKFSDVTVRLTDYTDIVNGLGRDNTYQSMPGNQLIVGNVGLTTLDVSGKLASYALAATGSAVTLTDLSGNGGVDLLVDVDRLIFSDGALALDTLGSTGSVYRIYSAMFNRAPDMAGLGYWMKALDSGAKVVEIANGFVSSAEFVSLYGANATDETFIKALYNNVLHRDPDDAGRAYWVNALHSGGTRSEALVGFSDSAENIEVMSHIIPVGIAYTPWLG
jgi:hypothetical protein